ncbi:MAG: DUF4959 domain-containing protein [Bacteroidia bacterium]|nr:MAG: DUF4959 domain-containing protein [Bacteroidia bacterium]
MKKIYKIHTNLLFYVSLGIMVLLIGCKADIGIEPARLGVKPTPLTNLSSEPRPGGALISYTLPNTTDLRYVSAVYTLDNGTTMTTKASVYDNKVLVEGFAKVAQYDVTLKAVSVGDVESDPVTIKITTGQPMYETLAESFLSNENFFSTFGGVNLIYKNDNASNIILRLFKYTQDNGWQIVNETYTKSKEGIIRVRGEQPLETKFGVVVKDQWGNTSDTIERLLTPLEEIEFEGLNMYNGIERYSQLNRNGDYVANWSAQSGSAEMQISLFDGIPAIPYYNTKKQWWGKAAPVPFQFTLDLGQKVQLSRIKMWGRNDNYSLLFQATHPKEFEVYGSNSPAADGSWDSWSYIGTYEGVRPSGLAFGVNATAEDQDYAKKGEDFEVNWEIPGGFRYIRIKVNCTWNGIREQEVGNALTIAISELKLFGKYVN